MKRYILLIICLSFVPLLLKSQGAAIYTPSWETGITFTSIDATGIAVTQWRAGGNTGNNRSYPIPIGFSFNYLGGLYTELNVSTNGFIDFSSNPAAGYQDKPYGFDNSAFTLPEPDGTLLAIAPLYDDLMITWGYTLENSVKYITTGDAGSRVFTLEWIYFSFEQSYSDHVNFQVKLYEADGSIEFIYGAMNAAGITPNFTCGINTQVMSVPPTSAQLLTQQSPNSAVFNASPQNSLSVIPASNSKILLTGCILPDSAGTISGPTSVCQSSSGLVYSVPVIPNATDYTWILPEGFAITSGNNTNAITVSTSAIAVAGTITVAGSNSCGDGNSSAMAVAVNPRPMPAITGPASVCAGITGSVYSTQAGMTNYLWTVTAGGTITSGSGTNSIIVNWSTPGAEMVGVNYTNQSGCTAVTPAAYPVVVNPNPQPVISGPNSVCANTPGNVYTTQSSMTNYIWSVSSGGTITAGGTTTSNSITIKWNTAGAQTVSVNFTNSNGCTSQVATIYPVSVNPIPVPAITGPASSCIDSASNVYTTQQGMTNYIWNVSAGGTITGGGTTASNNVIVTWTALGANTISVNYTTPGGCTAPAATIYNVTVNTRPTPTLSGPATACAGSSNNVYTTQAGMTGYAWVVSAGGSITAGGTSTSGSATVHWNTSGAQWIVVNYNNSFGCPAMNSTVYNVTVNPQPTPVITGPNTVCAGTTGNVYLTEAGMSGYGWIVSPGGTITAGGTATSNSVTVRWNAGGQQTVSVNYNNSFGCPNATPTVYNVTVNPLPVPTISGPSTACSNTSGHIYTTEDGMTGYVWTISAGGIITAGGGSNSIIVSWNSPGTRNVYVIYTDANSCAATTPSAYSVVVAPAPVPSVSGPSNTCSGTSGYIYSTETGMNNYQWNISAGGTITSGTTSNSVTVTWNTAGAQTIGVSYTNLNGCASINPSSKNVTVSNQPVPVITGNANPCINSGNYSYSTDNGMTNYQWTASPAGLITSGSGTNTIFVTWVAAGSQWVSVNYSTPAGCTGFAPTVFNVNPTGIPDPAGTINGLATVCAGASGIAYSVNPIPNALTYIWNLPPGATIASGSGTPYITVNFPVNAVSGYMSVMGVNGCGGGPPSPAFSITVSSVPGAAGPISGLDSVARGAVGIPYSIAPVTGATGYVWTVPSGATIQSGPNTNAITVNFSGNATSGNFMVTATNSCGIGTASPLFHVTMMPPPLPPVITQTGDYLYSNYSVGNQWYLNGAIIPGATEQNYHVVQNGLYGATVTRYGMQSGISNQIQVILTGMDKPVTEHLSIYPVPGNGQFAITLDKPMKKQVILFVYNQIGSIIYKSSEVGKTDHFHETIDLRPISPGIYTLMLQADDQWFVRKLIVK